LQVEASTTFNSSLSSGFTIDSGRKLVFFFEDIQNTGFIILNPTTLQQEGFYPISPPTGYSWAAYPYCRPSGINKAIAFCSSELTKSGLAYLYTFSLSLTTFKVVNSIDTAGDFVVSSDISSIPAYVFVVSDYVVEKVYNYNLTGYDETLKQVWQVELPSNTDAVYAVESIGDSIAVSIVLTKTYNNVVLLYDSKTGALRQQYPNTIPCDLVFDASYPSPFFFLNGTWTIVGLGLPTNEGGVILAKINYKP